MRTLAKQTINDTRFEMRHSEPTNTYDSVWGMTHYFINDTEVHPETYRDALSTMTGNAGAR